MRDIKKVRVIILTSNYRIMGEISLPKGARLTDHIAHSKSFFAVTNAEVTNMDGDHVATAEFMDIHRDHVQVIMPDEPLHLGS